jgi:hypothetical protein
MVMRSRRPGSAKPGPAFEAQRIGERRGRTLVPAPPLVAAALRRVPCGRRITPQVLRARRAEKPARAVDGLPEWR